MSRHSNDLRQRVITFFKSDKSKTKTAKTFQISRDTLDSWISLDSKGELFEIKEYHHGKISKIDLNDLKTYVDQHSDSYYSEIATKFGIKTTQAFRLIKKLKYTSKKNKPFIEKQT
jgi:transposase